MAEPPRKRARKVPPAPQPDQPQLLVGQPSTPRACPTSQSPAAPSRAKRPKRTSKPYDPNGPGRPRNIVPEAAPANPQDRGIGPPLAPAPTVLDRAVGETPNISPLSPDGTQTAPMYPTVVDAYGMSGAGTAPEVPSASGAVEFDPEFLKRWQPGLEDWDRTADEAPTAMPAQAPQPQPQGLYHHGMGLDLKFVGVRTGTHHGKCTPGRHHAGCTAREVACVAAINGRAEVPLTSIAKHYLERNGLRWVPALEQHGGPGSTNVMVSRESSEPCQVAALVVGDLAHGLDMLLCRKDAVKLGYLPALQDNEHTVTPLENHVSVDHGSSCVRCVDSMPVDTQDLPPAPYPHPTPPAPPAMGLHVRDGGGVMSTTGSLGDPAMPAGNLPITYSPPPSASGSGTNLTAAGAAAASPWAGYGTFLGKQFEEAWDILHGGGDNSSRNHHEHEEPRAL